MLEKKMAQSGDRHLRVQWEGEETKMKLYVNEKTVAAVHEPTDYIMEMEDYWNKFGNPETNGNCHTVIQNHPLLPGGVMMLGERLWMGGAVTTAGGGAEGPGC